MDGLGWCPRCGNPLTGVVLAWAGGEELVACVGVRGRSSCGWSGAAGYGAGGGRRGPKDDPALAREVGRRVRRSREVKGWSQRMLADAVGMFDHSMVQKIEGGTRFPSLPTLAALARALDCRPRDLLP